VKNLDHKVKFRPADSLKTNKNITKPSIVFKQLIIKKTQKKIATQDYKLYKTVNNLENLTVPKPVTGSQFLFAEKPT